ncbi:MAG: tRNA1(Val) (adenine(37)-N6)-methyltransferase [Bacteroidales bacterium]
MSSGYFRFKQFTVRQELAAFGVTTDSVLLGAWARIESAGTILDIGTGTGLLALMAAQRSGARIVAIEPDRNSFIQAGINFAASPWHERMTLIHTSVQDFRPDAEQLFDAIITNPPYFVDSLLNPDQDRAQARHTVSLSHADLAASVARLLAPAGSLHIILPVNEARKFTEAAVIHGLYCATRLLVRPIPSIPPARVLMSLQRQAESVCEESELVIEKGGRHIYSDEYVSLTKDFYLKF